MRTLVNNLICVQYILFIYYIYTFVIPTCMQQSLSIIFIYIYNYLYIWLYISSGYIYNIWWNLFIYIWLYMLVSVGDTHCWRGHTAISGYMTTCMCMEILVTSVACWTRTWCGVCPGIIYKALLLFFPTQRCWSFFFWSLGMASRWNRCFWMRTPVLLASVACKSIAWQSAYAGSSLALWHELGKEMWKRCTAAEMRGWKPKDITCL